MKTPCGKRGYPSAKTAKRASARMGNKIRPYFCRACGAWHVTGYVGGERR